MRVSLQNSLVEDTERSHDHLVVFICHAFRDHGCQLLVREDTVDFQAQVAEGWQEVILFTPPLSVVSVGKVEVERPYQGWVLIDDLAKVISCEGFISKPTLYLGQ